MLQKRRSIVTVILAGGEGRRLGALTTKIAKPAVPFGGKYRIIDFALSNCLNSGDDYTDIYVMTQYKQHTLGRHIQENWAKKLHSVDIVPSQGMVSGVDVYHGTADAIFQNVNIFIEDGTPEDILILSGDHIYVMDMEQFHAYHHTKNASFTICAMPVKIEDAAGEFGVLEINAAWQVIGFEEKPEHPKEIPNMPGYCLASMGNYVASFEFLADKLQKNADAGGGHDFGKDIIPKFIATGESVFAYNYLDNKIPGQIEHYWRDVGTIDALMDANMDLARINTVLNLYDPNWFIYTPADNLAPAKINSLLPGSKQFILSGGCIVQECFLFHVVLGRNVRIWDNARVENSVIHSGVTIGAGCNIVNAIIDECIDIPPGTMIGHNRTDDEARGFYYDQKNSASNIVIVPHGYVFT